MFIKNYIIINLSETHIPYVLGTFVANTITFLSNGVFLYQNLFD